jgi:putative tricarboxylic transport membrane protein
MDGFIQFGQQFVSLASPINLFVMLGAILLGIVFGALPGLTATLGVALLTTVTFSISLSVETSMMALMGVYVGAIYGGCHPAILLNIPGTAAGAATAVEGYPLSQQGRGGEAIATATVMSFLGTVFGVLAMLLCIPVLTRVALLFQSSEYFLLALFGVLICGSLTAPDIPLKGWIAGLFGMLLATVGMDPTHGFQRFTLGLPELIEGIKPIPVILGGFAIPQIIRSLAGGQTKTTKSAPIQSLWPRISILKTNVKTAIRSGLMGVGIGSVPGVGEDIAAWMSYDTAKRYSREPEAYGKGSMEGVIAAETANNACIGGALIPLLTLGIPGSPPAMMLLGAIMLHGVIPGPRLAEENPTFIPQMAAILMWASLFMLVCGFAMSRLSVFVLRIPVHVLMPFVALFTVLGSYAFDYSLFNVWFMLGFGLLAYFMEENGYPIAPLVIGIILGPMAEDNLRRALIDHQGSLLPFVTRPISLVFVILILVSLIFKRREVQ